MSRLERIKPIARRFGFELGPTKPESFSLIEQDVINQYYTTVSKVAGRLDVDLYWKIILEHFRRRQDWNTAKLRSEVSEAEQNLTERGFLEIGEGDLRQITERGVSAYFQINKIPFRQRMCGLTVHVAAE